MHRIEFQKGSDCIMGANTKIFVFKAKELIYTGIFLVLGILFLVLLIFMFLPKQDQAADTEPAMGYIAGVYSSSIHLGGSSVDVKVTIADGRITSLSLSDLSEETAAMYPLLTSAVEDINEQLKTISSIEELTFQSDSPYTNTLLKQAMQNALMKAVPE